MPGPGTGPRPGGWETQYILQYICKKRCQSHTKKRCYWNNNKIEMNLKKIEQLISEKHKTWRCCSAGILGDSESYHRGDRTYHMVSYNKHSNYICFWAIFFHLPSSPPVCLNLITKSPSYHFFPYQSIRRNTLQVSNMQQHSCGKIRSVTRGHSDVNS